MSNSTIIRRLSLSVALAIPSAIFATRADAGELQALREQVHAIGQQLKITLKDRAFSLASTDGAQAVKVCGLVQMDNPVFICMGVGMKKNGHQLASQVIGPA